MTHNQTHTSLFGAISLGSFWQGLWAILHHGPSWEVLPPLLVGVVGLIGVINTVVNDSHRRRLERVKLDAELKSAAEDSARRRLFRNATFDQVEGLN